MAELDKVEFEFPDEIEAKEAAKAEKAEIKEEDDSSEIEIVANPEDDIKPAPAPDEPIFESTTMCSVSIMLFLTSGAIASIVVTAMHPGHDTN